MKRQFQRKLLAASLMAVSASAAVPAFAQAPGSGAIGLEEIVVTARRRDESLQDVPLTVNAVTSEQIDNLNVRKFEDLQAVVAGLTLKEDPIAPTASMRGVRFDTFLSGNNPTVEFYLNDSSIDPQSVMQAMFDVGQVEVLRGPQGTLRGRASPSGSITISTQRPVLDDFGGYVDTTFNDIGGQNVRGALNVPIIEDMLAVRVAGFWEENEGNRAENVYTSDESEYEGSGYRVSVAFEPVDFFSANLMHQRVEPERTLLTMVESANIANPALAASNPVIKADDRLAVQDVPGTQDSVFEVTNLQLSLELGNHTLNYVGALTDLDNDRVSSNDATNAFDATFPSAFQGAVATQHTVSNQEKKGHELRLQSSEPLFDVLDYVVGYMQQTNDSPSTFNSNTFLRGIPGVPQAPTTVISTPLERVGDSKERSFFGNLTYHLSEATELSAGLRRINYEDEGDILVSGVVQAGLHTDQDEQTTIYSTSLKHDFNDNLMGYISYGTSWRPGATAVGDTSLSRSALQTSFYQLEPEESDSIELGTKVTMMDDRLRLNTSVFHQEFDNFPYRAASGIYYQSFTDHDRNPATAPAATVAQHNFGAAVPVEINGIEVEAFFQATDSLDLSALVSYAKGEIDNGTIPCNDYLPKDGIPDTSGVPTLAQIVAAAGSDNLTSCEVSQRANFAPLWTGTLSSEYRFMVGNLDAYVRGLWTFYGSSENDPANRLDDVDAYNELNLYVGVGDPDDAWDVMVYGKNLTETEEVLRREANPGFVAYRNLAAGGAVVNAVSNYREVEINNPREIGVNFKYNF